MTQIEYEKRIVEKMVRMFFRHKKLCSGECSTKDCELCAECSQLLEYAHNRLDHCKFGENKPTCKKCPIHCYKPEMKQKMREVMRWSGPRMILYHPIDAIKHLFR